MQIKRKELKQIVAGLQGLFSDVPGRGTAALEAFVLGQRLLESAHPDPVDVVPVQDYPFPIANHWSKVTVVGDTIEKADRLAALVVRLLNENEEPT